MATRIGGVEVRDVPADETGKNYELPEGRLLSRDLADRIKAAIIMGLRTDTQHTIEGLGLLETQPEDPRITDPLAIALFLEEIDLRNPLVRLFIRETFQVG